jgi:L-asparaginase
LKTGEGQGGLIGIEAEMPIEDQSCNSCEIEAGLRRGRVVSDFNCGGMYRAWIEETPAGDKERVMIFRDEY